MIAQPSTSTSAPSQASSRRLVLSPGSNRACRGFTEGSSRQMPDAASDPMVVGRVGRGILRPAFVTRNHIRA